MATPDAAGPRERLLASAITLVRQRGVAGTGLNDLLAHSRTARGSIYQHFPGGKDELVAASTRLAGQVVVGRAARAAELDDPVAIVHQVVERARRGLLEHDFGLGCPIVAAAVSGPDHDPAVRAAAETLDRWVEVLCDGLERTGLERRTAEGVASLVVSAVEGALLHARAARSVVPLDHVEEQLTFLVQAQSAAGQCATD
ncbi:TetR/AcrR family transcriptional regulator [Nocardioides stalactiti]|uniref:TetR/AcrR family transcriptional regulator n=1 Tax=Nocardioides stalactiti TaxID=2755356 RepID=UPI0016042FE7|nr:TetR/AcrR family transcriptional regulator [Nocardioides stalactiti]